MKILGIAGSLRKGNTYSLLHDIKGVFEEAGIFYEVIHSANLDFGYCDGCLECDETGKCYKNDDMNAVSEKIELSDGLVLASPTRWSLLSGEMKVFLDRLNPLATKEVLVSKKAIVFAVGQTGIEDNSVFAAAKSIGNFCTSAGIEVIDTILVHDCLNADDATKNREAFGSCMKAAEKLIESLSQNKYTNLE